MSTLFSVLTTILLTFICVDSLNIHISVNEGDDRNSGLSNHAALKTLNAAKYMIRDIKQQYGLPPEGISVLISPGLYFESLYFNSLDSGTASTPIRWQGIGENVRISGGLQISPSAFTNCTSPLQKTNYPLKCVNLKTLNVTNVGQIVLTSNLKACDHNKLELYYKGETQILSRYPNINYKTQMYVFTNITSVTNANTFKWSNNDANSNNAAAWSQEPDGWLHGYWQFDWADSYVSIGQVTNSGSSFTISSPDLSRVNFGALKKGARFYVVNMLSELDSMSEYYVDSNSLTLYWYPPDTTLQDDIFVSVSEYGIHLNDSTQHLSFDNLNMAYNKISSIYGRNVNDINVTNSFVSNNGGNSIDLRGTNLYIANNDVSYSGCIGIGCVGGDYYTLTAGNNRVLNNTIYNFARWKRTYLPGLYFGGVGNEYSYNNITFGPHNGITGGGNVEQSCNNNITHNLVQNTTFETSDSGAMYTCGQAKQGWINRGNMFTYNTVKNVRNLVPLARGQDVTLNGIYLDDEMSGWDVSFNTFINMDRGVFVGGGRNTRVYNNYCDSCDYCLHLDNRGMNWQSAACKYPNGELWEGL